MMAKTQPDPNMDVYQAYPRGYRGIIGLKRSYPVKSRLCHPCLKWTKDQNDDRA